MLTSGPPDTAGFPTRRYLGNYARCPARRPRHARTRGERRLTRRVVSTASPDFPDPPTRRSVEGHNSGRSDRRVSPASRGTRASGPVPPLALRVRADRAQEVHAAEVGPVRLAEVELAVRALPEQEAAEALLPRGADDEVGVRLALGVEVLGDVLDLQALGQLLDARAVGGVRREERAHGVGDLLAAAVADGDVDDHAVDVGGGVRALLELARGVCGQQVRRAHRVDPPPTG